MIKFLEHQKDAIDDPSNQLIFASIGSGVSYFMENSGYDCISLDYSSDVDEDISVKYLDDMAFSCKTLVVDYGEEDSFHKMSSYFRMIDSVNFDRLIVFCRSKNVFDSKIMREGMKIKSWSTDQNKFLDDDYVRHLMMNSCEINKSKKVFW